MTKLAEGYTSEIYEIDSHKVLKLYKPAFNAIAEIEYQKMRHLAHCGINVPTVYENEIIDGRHGYVMDKIDGKPFSEELTRERTNLDPLIRQFAELQQKINKTSIRDECFSNQISVITDRIETNMRVEERKKKIILRLLSEKSATNLCHNDFHFNNILLKDGVFYVIDWNGSFAGDWLLDIAKTYLVLKFLPFEIGCTKLLGDLRSYIVSRYVLECRDLYAFDESDFLISVLIRIAELTSLNVPERESLLSYFNDNSRLFERY